LLQYLFAAGGVQQVSEEYHFSITRFIYDPNTKEFSSGFRKRSGFFLSDNNTKDNSIDNQKNPLAFWPHRQTLAGIAKET
jgi:hypothetical protein